MHRHLFDDQPFTRTRTAEEPKPFSWESLEAAVAAIKAAGSRILFPLPPPSSPEQSPATGCLLARGDPQTIYPFPIYSQWREIGSWGEQKRREEIGGEQFKREYLGIFTEEEESPACDTQE